MKIININMEKMKYRLVSFLCLFIIISSLSIFGQSTEKNYIIQTDLLVKVHDPGNIKLLPDGQKSDIIQYFDGLGRLIQTNNYHQSPSSKDFIQHIEYDLAGHQKYNFLPFSSDANGNYLSNAYNLTMQFYTYPPQDITVPVTHHPYGETAFDGSPLDRVIKQGFAGDSWQLNSHPKQFDYSSNSSNQIYRLELDEQTLQFRVPQNNYIYSNNSLYLIETKDENGNITRTYKDKLGRIILQESELDGIKLRTYYLYNVYGDIAVVISPKGSQQLIFGFSSTPSFIQSCCYTYKYDSRNRIIEKRIPGMNQPIFYIYDCLDRVILTQDGNLNKEKKWLFTKYDIFGRTVLEGKYCDAQHLSRSDMQIYADTYIADHSLYESRNGNDPIKQQGYTLNAFPPFEGSEVLKVYYYDDYDFNYDNVPDYVYRKPAGFDDQNLCENVRGLLTGSKAKMMDDRLPQDPFLIDVTFYDCKQRIIQQQSNNHLHGFDTITTAYNFIGDVILRKCSHGAVHVDQVAFSLTTMIERFVFDPARRLKEKWMKINNQAEFKMVAMNYNELSHLIEKNLYTMTGTLIQSLDYRYNERGWLKSINMITNGNDADDAFSEGLLYDGSLTALQSTPQYNGNISTITWKNPGSNIWEGYGYTYDSLNRLTKAIYGQNTGPTWTECDNYSMPLIQYDANGNITRLKRNGFCGTNFILIDDLTYYYYDGNSNMILGVSDGGSPYCGFRDIGAMPEYIYDANGNMIRDVNKGIQNITYNHLNLPVKIEFENNRRIEFLYDANGNKLCKKYFENNTLMKTIDYSCDFVYSDKSLDYFITSEGRMKRYIPGIYSPDYFIKDHLGDVRVVLSSTLGIIQVTDYYPFGLEIPVNRTSDNKIKYNSKELQSEAGLDWYDYGARFYDPTIGRFIGIDPIAEKFNWLSPYNYAENSPVAFLDLWGLQKVYYLNGFENNNQFKEIHAAASSTTFGQEFYERLKSQSHFDVFYFEYKGQEEGKQGKVGENDYNKSRLLTDSFGLKANILDDYFKDNPGKEALLVGISVSSKDHLSNEELVDRAEVELHEENHANKYLNVFDYFYKALTSEIEDHFNWFGKKEHVSPDAEEIKNNPEYKDTNAYKAVQELWDWISEKDRL